MTQKPKSTKTNIDQKTGFNKNHSFSILDEIWRSFKPKQISESEIERLISEAQKETINKPVKKNRVVLDVPIFISALLQPKSIFAQFMQLWGNQQIHLLMSSTILSEIEYLLRHPKIIKKLSLTENQITAFLDLLSRNTHHVPGQLHLDLIDNHPIGNAILSCAVEGNANYIISNDPQLLKVKYYEGILILSTSSLHIIQ